MGNWGGGWRGLRTFAVGLVVLASCGKHTHGSEPIDLGASGSGGDDSLGGAQTTSAGGAGASGGQPSHPACLPDPVCGLVSATDEAIDDCEFEVPAYCKGVYTPGVVVIDCELVPQWVAAGAAGQGGEKGEMRTFIVSEGNGTLVVTLVGETCERARRAGRVDMVLSCIDCVR